VRAEDMEEQVAQVLAQIKLPPNWRERIAPFIHSVEEMEAKRQERAELCQRLSRLTELYLEGDIGRERYKRERTELIERTMSLTFVGKSAILSAVRALEDFEATWAEASQLEKKKLLRELVAVASVRGDLLCRVHLSATAYPLAQLSMRHSQCLSGSDGRCSESAKTIRLLSPDKVYLHQRV